MIIIKIQLKYTSVREYTVNSIIMSQKMLIIYICTIDLKMEKEIMIS